MINFFDVPEANVYTEPEAWSYADTLPTRVDKFCFWMWWFCICALLGYDQNERWNIWVNGECDCSSLVYECLWRAGFLARPAGSPWNYTKYTGTLADELVRAGFTWHAAIGDPEYGDVVLNSGHHVAACIGWSQVAQASIDENGNATGGQTGDQGNETNVRGYYWYWAGWDGFWRPPEDKPTHVTERPTAADSTTRHGEGWRLFNPYTLEHLYTLDKGEYDGLTALGWNGEGFMFDAPSTGQPVYRLRNPYADPNGPSGHHYTRSLGEAQSLWDRGWEYEGVAWYSGGDEPVWRLYNPYSGEHLFTPNEKECARLVEFGWQQEGVGWYADKAA